MNKIILLAALVVAFSCNRQKEEDVSKKWDNNNRVKVENEEKISELIAKYDAVNNWDSTPIYSYLLEDVFLKKNKMVLVKGFIGDIERRDSSYVILMQDHYMQFQSIVQIVVPIGQFEKMQSDLQANYLMPECAFVIKVLSFKTTYPKLDFEVEKDGDDYSTYLTYKGSDGLKVIRGQFVDYYRLKTSNQ